MTAKPYNYAKATTLLIEEGMADYEFEREDYESAALFNENITRDEVGFDLDDPYERANYYNFLTFEEVEKVSWFHGDVDYDEYNEYREEWYSHWAPDVYGVPVFENGQLIGAKVYQDQGHVFPWYVGFTPCTEDNFKEAVTSRSGIRYVY